MDTILFTGLGSIGSRHLRLLRERELDADIHAYRSSESATSYEGITEHYSFSDALSVSPDIAFITNPTSMHVETAIECANVGADLFIEKPLSDSPHRIDELKRTCETNHILTYIGCQFRFNPILNRVKTLLKRREYGSVRSYRAYSGSYLPDWQPNKDYRESYSAKRELGGGVALDLIHEIDYSYWLFGPPAHTVHLSGQASDLEINVEDYVELSLETEDGVIGQIHLDYYRRTPRRTLEISCSEGVITADLISQDLRIDTPKSTMRETFEYERDDIFRAQLDHFFDHIDRGVPFQNDISEAEEVLRIALKLQDDYE
jgi:predicted dehydrogenase